MTKPLERSSSIKESIILFLPVVLLGAMLFFTLAVYLVFEFQHTKDFATRELEKLGFEQVEIIEKHTIGYHLTLLPTEDWFDFVGVRDGEMIEDKLICSRYFQDFKKSRCENKARRREVAPFGLRTHSTSSPDYSFHI